MEEQIKDDETAFMEREIELELERFNKELEDKKTEPKKDQQNQSKEEQLESTDVTGESEPSEKIDVTDVGKWL